MKFETLEKMGLETLEFYMENNARSATGVAMHAIVEDSDGDEICVIFEMRNGEEMDSDDIYTKKRYIGSYNN